MPNRGNQVVSGNDAMVWINNEIWDDISSVEHKITGEFEDVKFLGDKRTYKKYLGYTGEGTLNLNKVHSRGAMILGEAFKTGIMPEVKIILKIKNEATGRAERIALLDVTFTEFGASTESKSIITEELPFTFSDYDVLEVL